MKTPTSFYWHDYETSGIDPRRDRALQFAGIRTDLDFNPISKPLVIYAVPADDLLPQPAAALVTGITPQRAKQEGMPEADFFQAIHNEISKPGTCTLGYNSIRFDDEFTRYGLYRNFFDPYAREWQNGNSRWDLIDLVRLTRALRPEGINWPEKEDGSPSFRLEELTAANNIQHEGAHDALVDVRATIALARLIRDKQPRLFDYVFEGRDKVRLAKMLNVREQNPVLHVSARYPARLGCIAAVVPVAMHPTNKNGIIVYDLRVNPTPLLTLDVDEIRKRIFTPTSDFPEGVERIPLKAVHINRAPVVVPMNTITEEARERWQMDERIEQLNLQAIRQATGLQEKLSRVFSESEFEASSDPDQALYGGFLSDTDRRLCDKVRATEPEQLGNLHLAFDDAKLEEMLFRYRARNWPELLSSEEQARWQEYRTDRLTRQDGGSSITLSDYRRELSRLAVDSSLSADKRAVVDALLDWPVEIGLDD